MKSKATLKHFRQSPRKVRIELDQIRGKNVEMVLNYLRFSKTKASKGIEKIVLSAVSNFKNKFENSDLNLNSLLVRECYADGGPHIKRFRAASMGRISRLNKPTSHITIVISEKN
tara:strand:- start:1845 stop:2189 length:345 start_codon:yes stop_codon:yes gene_type:complete